MADAAADRTLIPRLSTLARFTFVDVILWCLRIGVTIVVIGGTIGVPGTHGGAHGLIRIDFERFGGIDPVLLLA